jgi:GTPase SAR1 family protein
VSISLLVVGHANTGKTSLIRTLLRRQDFGEVGDRAGITRHVESVKVNMGQQTIVTLTDTPGFEDSTGLWDVRHSNDFCSFQGSEWLQPFCESRFAQAEFEQEAKIIKQLMHTDIILYVIDIRQAPLGKYLDELALLASANKPIIPILNFSATPSDHLKAWRDVLAERHLHAVVKYDSVAFYFEDEKRLYQSVQSLMPEYYDTIHQLIEFRERAAKLRLTMATNQLAELLINAACSRLECAQYPPNETESTLFENKIRQIEQSYIAELLRLYEFQQEDVMVSSLPINNDQWKQDIFDSETLKEWGVETGTSALKGAAIGAGIDVISAGLTLGTATTIGALLGATWKTGQHYKDTLKSKLTNRHYLCLDTATLTLLCLRGLTAIQHLHQRGHAAQHTFQLETPTKNNEFIEQIKPFWKQAQQHPEWETQELPDSHPVKSGLRESLEAALSLKTES